MNAFEWNPRKAKPNSQKHGIDFADATSVFSARRGAVGERRQYRGSRR